jgi:hypothetical protein
MEVIVLLLSPNTASERGVLGGENDQRKSGLDGRVEDVCGTIERTFTVTW